MTMAEQASEWGNDPGVGNGGAAAAFSEAMVEACGRAVEAAGGAVERTFRVGGRLLRLRFAGPALTSHVTPALEHLAVMTSDKPDLTVGLWDTASTGVYPPGSRWHTGDYIARGEVKHTLGDRVQISFSIDSGTLHYYDLDRGIATCWVRHPEHIPAWEVAAPLRPLLGWWAGEIGGQLAHGAAVGDGVSGILLAARGGSGKSTVALACLEAGLRYLGDDYVLLRDSDQPAVCSLYNTAKLVPGHLDAKLPQLRRLAMREAEPGQDKVIMFLKESHGDLLANEMALRAIVVPRVSEAGRTALRSASRVAVLMALAPTSIFQLPGAGEAALRTMSDLVQRVPGYSLELGPDLDESVGVIRELLAAEGRYDC